MKALISRLDKADFINAQLVEHIRAVSCKEELLGAPLHLDVVHQLIKVGVRKVVFGLLHHHQIDILRFVLNCEFDLHITLFTLADELERYVIYLKLKTGLNRSGR